MITSIKIRLLDGKTDLVSAPSEISLMQGNSRLVRMSVQEAKELVDALKTVARHQKALQKNLNKTKNK